MAGKMIIFLCLSLCGLTAFLTSAQGETPVNLGQQTDLYEGDIVLTSRNRNGILKANRWPNNTVYYAYADGWDEGFIGIIETAMRAIEASTCIKFVKRTTERDYAYIKNTRGGCYAVIGRAYGMQPVNLMHIPKTTSCLRHHIIVHELLHTVGLWHEQSRHDRDDFITVHYDNIDEAKWSQFTKLNENQSSTYGIPYNYRSVMHYDSLAFGNGKGFTMEAKDPQYTKVLGRANYGDELDFEKVRRIYECKGQYTPATTTQTTLRTTSTPKECFDAINYCANWVSSCNQGWARESCRKTCGVCK